MLYDGHPREISLLLERAMPHRKAGRRLLRRVFETCCALAGLVFLSPLMALIAAAIALDDGGPVFYWQPRVGKDLRKFRLLKFRSMHTDGAKGSLLTAPGDSRVTRVGRFLRRAKLDELPQLVNVLNGEMQFVGIRPQVERFVQIYLEEYKELLTEPPGVTGPASLLFRNEEELYDKGRPVEEQYVQRILPIKLQMALEYSRTRTFFSDLEIIIRTVLALQPPAAVGSNARIASAMPALPNFVSRKSS